VKAMVQYETLNSLHKNSTALTYAVTFFKSILEVFSQTMESRI
jgi:hypothetical protein